MSVIRENKLVVGLLAAVVAVVIGFLAFGVFGVQFLFIDEKVDEAAPTFGNVDASDGNDGTDAEIVEAIVEAAGEPDKVMEEPAADMPGEITTIAEGSFIGRDHPTSGQAVVLNDGSAQRFLRFEDFKTDNGPDLNVYLTRADANASAGDLGSDFIDLGNLKGNVGSQNYEIPEGVDLSEYDTVVIWCVRFSVAFGAADFA